jgi:hypothetical protein
VTDQKPPRISGDERSTLVALLQYQRDSVVRKVAGVSDDDAKWSAVPTGTSLLWIVKHLTGAEAIWFLGRFAGLDVAADILDDRVAMSDTLEAAIAGYRAMWERVDAVIRGSSLDTPCATVDEGELPDLRWVLAHVLEETARHAGHADIIRELIDGQTGR